MKHQVCERCHEKFKIHAGEIERLNCEPCVEEIEHERILDQTIELIDRSLKPENQILFRQMNKKRQRLLAEHAWADGIVWWKTPDHWTPEMIERFEAFKAKGKRHG